MDFLSKLESWDYLALALLLFSLWLLLGGTGKLHEADPERVDEKKLRVRAYGGACAAGVYLLCRLYLLCA